MGLDNRVGRRVLLKKAIRTGGAVYAAPTIASFAISSRVGAQVSPGFGAGATPAILTITPNTGPTTGGTLVTIRGSGFAPGATVTIGGNPATGVTVVDAMTITATSPPGAAGLANVTVTNPNGRANTLTNGFTFTAGGGAIPGVTGVAPNSGPTTGGTPVTITGTNFVPGTTVTIGGVPATGVTVVNGTTITATSPPGAAGPATVTVTTPTGATGTLPNGFTFRMFTSTARAFTTSGNAAPLAALGEVGLSTLPPGGTTMVANVMAAPVLTTGAGTNTTTNTSTPTQAGATAVANVANPSIAGGVITAGTITTTASSTATGTTASSTGSSMITGLTVAGVAVAVTGAPNQMVPITLPVVGTVATLIINEQVPTGNGTTTSGITVNALRLAVTSLGLGTLPVGASVIVGSANTNASAT